MRPQELTVAANVRDGAADVPAWAACLAAQTRQGFSVLVVDDGSADGTVALLRAQRLPRTRIVRRGREGLQAARRTLFQQVRTPWVLLVDMDLRLARDAVERFLEAAHPDVAGVGAPTSNRTPTRAARAHDSVRRLVRRLRTDRRGRARWLEGSPTLWRMGAVAEVGHSTAEPVSEDLDLSLRVRAAGHRLGWLREPVATHPDPPSWKALWHRERATGVREGRMARAGQPVLRGPRLLRLTPWLGPLYPLVAVASLPLVAVLGAPRGWGWLAFHWMNLAYAVGFARGLRRSQA